MSKALPALSILYGSATGNAEHIAKELSTSIPSKGEFYSSVICVEMNQFKRKCQKAWDASGPSDPKHPVIFITSTTGNGDAPENAGRFIRYIKKKDTVAVQPFQNCIYAVLALGDTNYDQFCATGKMVDRKVQELGGIRAKRIGLADEGTGLEDVVEPWLETIMNDMRKAFLTPTTNSKNRAATTTSKEEKKEDNIVVETTPVQKEPLKPIKDSVVTSPDSTTKPPLERTNQSPGIATISSIAKQHNFTLLQEAPSSSVLPSLTASMSSCALIDKATVGASTCEITALDKDALEEERKSIRSGSSLSAGCYFNLQNPYPSTIRAARYLTNTSTTPISNAASILTSNDSTATTSRHKDVVQELTKGFDLSQNPKNGKRVIELALSLPEDYSLEYEPGDSIGMLVRNEYTFSFQTIISLLEKEHGMNVHEQLVSVDEKDPISIYEAIATCVDITSVVKKRVLARLAQLCSDTKESILLSQLASKLPEGETLYKEFVEKYALNIGHILALFPSCKPTVQDILGICDGMVPRYYSITSSPLVMKDQLTVVFSVVDYCIKDIPPPMSSIIPTRRGGLATQFLEINCASFLINSPGNPPTPSIQISIFPKPTDDFRLPKSITTPIILIGPGTGVAPFLGFLSHREQLVKEKKEMEAQAEEGTWRGGFEIANEDNENGSPSSETKESKNSDDARKGTAKNVLFFGCRWPDHDYLFQKELQEFVANKTLTSLSTAFSRIEPKEEQRYVQDEMKLAGRELVDMVCKENASVYVCGDGNAMGKDVQDCLASLLESYGGSIVNKLAEKDAGKVFVEGMKKKNKFVLDIWS